MQEEVPREPFQVPPPPETLDAIQNAGGAEPRTPSPRRTRRELLEGGPDLPTMTSSILPRTPPSAQPDLIRRPVVYAGQRIGYFQAYSYSDARRVVEDLATRMRSMRRLTWVPRNANIWENVDAVIMPQIEELSCVHPYDLRKAPWEYFQDSRMVPVFAHGNLTCTVILPRHLPLQEAEIRISRASTMERFWQLIMFGYTHGSSTHSTCLRRWGT